MRLSVVSSRCKHGERVKKAISPEADALYVASGDVTFECKSRGPYDVARLVIRQVKNPTFFQIFKVSLVGHRTFLISYCAFLILRFLISRCFAFLISCLLGERERERAHL